MEQLMTDKVIVVTGGGSGIGRAASAAFAREGGTVLVADINLQTAEETVRKIIDAGGTAIATETDVADAGSVQAMVDRALDEFGRLDCCFNNAGIGTASTGSTSTKILDMNQAAWDRTIATNLTSIWHCLRAEIPHLLERGGSIVNTASIASQVALPGSSAYVASKHGVAALTKSAAIEYASKGIRVNAICPGHVRTAILDRSIERRGGLDPRNPMKRFGESEEIAETVVWLCSEKSSFTTGALITVDGGRLAG